MVDLDNIMFRREKISMVKKISDKPVKKPTKKVTKKPDYGIGLDVGTGFLVGAGYKDGNKIDFKPLRNAFYSIDKETFSKNMFNKQSMKFVELGDNINVIGEDAMTLARIQNTSAKRPLSHGVINNKEKKSAPILKKMFGFCVKDFIKKEGETCVFSVPGPKIGDIGFDVDYHAMSIESLLHSFKLKPVHINEAYAVILSEMETSKNVTGIGFSFGAGLVNVAFVYKSMLVFSFSIDKSGDFIDQKAAETCGSSESVMNHLKEKELKLSGIDMNLSPELRTLMFTYRYVIKNTLKEVMNAFNRNDTANIVEPVPIVISGGTSLPDGFVDMFEQELGNVDLPFDITEIKTAKDRLAAVAKGCLLYAREIENENIKT